jgi:threonylcarbamoyladenosine tRNA methylthiotransferase MtaB
MPAVKGPLIKERAARLRAAGDAALLRHLDAQIGTRQMILTEGPRLGRTEGFAEVAFSIDQPEGTLMEVTISGHADGRLTV